MGKRELSEMQTNVRVAVCVSRIGDPLMEHIIAAIPDRSADEVKAVVSAMCMCGALRQKEDTVDHDWCYRLTGVGHDIYDSSIREFATQDNTDG